MFELDVDCWLVLVELFGDVCDVVYVVQEIEKLQQFQVGQIGGYWYIIVYCNGVIVFIVLLV